MTTNRFQTLAKGLCPELLPLYEDLHRNPEFGMLEFETAAKMEQLLGEMGFRVHSGIGATGVVGVFDNGPGPVVMLRAELDGLQIREETDSVFRSIKTMKVRDEDMPLSHACSHDLHMVSTIGAAKLLTQTLKDEWSGTLIVLFQPSEEGLRGGIIMYEELKSGLYSNEIPKADFALGFHASDYSDTGSIGIPKGWSASAHQYFTVSIEGVMGHSSIAAERVDPRWALSAIVSEIDNAINQRTQPGPIAFVDMRFPYNKAVAEFAARDENRDTIQPFLDQVQQVVDKAAALYNLPIKPEIELGRFIPQCYYHPETVDRLVPVLQQLASNEIVPYDKPTKHPGPNDDFCLLYHILGIKTVKLALGAKRKGQDTFGLHHPRYMPDYENAIPLSAAALTAGSIELFKQL